MTNDRNETIKAIKDALRRRSGRSWSVTGGRGTAWGWIEINALPSARTMRHRLRAGTVGDLPQNYEEYDSGKPGGSMVLADRQELGRLLGLDRPTHYQGESIPAGSDYRQEYVDRANGRTPTVYGEQYWD